MKITVKILAFFEKMARGSTWFFPTLNTFLRWRGLNPLQPITNQNANRTLKLLLQHQENH
jgi:hypothetical protein